jgi:heme exporter protein C
MKFLPLWFHKLGSPPYFYRFSQASLPWLVGLTAVTLLIGLVWGLVFAPPDYQQKDAYRIIYVHVPVAALSLLIYTYMAFLSIFYLIFRIKVLDVLAASCLWTGAAYTLLALVTGALWGKPMWGTWWVWDARLTSELILLFIYLGIIALRGAIEDSQKSSQAASILTIVGLVNIPIVKFSVDWWYTLHQGATIVRADGPAMPATMLAPLLISMLGFALLFVLFMFLEARYRLLARERGSQWVKELVENNWRIIRDKARL